MLNAETKRHIDAARDVLVGVAPNPMTQIDQITYALIYKFMDDMDQAAIKAGGEPSFFVGELEPYSWSKLVDARMGNQEKMNLYGEALQKFSEAKQLPELFRTIFRAAFLPYRSPETLGLFLKEINYFDYTHPEELGNAYEYLLSIMSAQGDAGQFRTPRHIIDFMVDVMNPTKDDKVLDPACGTGGFLVASYNHILEQHDGKDDPNKKEKPLTPDERKKLMANLEGYDIDPSMVRIAQVNMYLHQFKNPKIFQYDSLTSEERWNDKFDVVLANPPFMSPKGGIKPHNKFAIQSNRSEVLFVDYIANHLKPNGRAAIIVPEGIIFQSGKAYKQLRKELVEGGLYAVVSLPSGVFNPYSGVKTSILLINNEIAKQKDEILFVKISNDGFDLGATKKVIEQDDLPLALKFLTDWEGGGIEASSICSLVSKLDIADSGDYNLSGERYRAAKTTLNSKWQLTSLGELCRIQTGKRDANEGNPQGAYHFFTCAKDHSYIDSFAFDTEALLIAGNGDVGAVKYFKGKFDAYQRTYVLTDFKNVNPRFLYFVLSNSLREHLFDLKLGNTMPYIKMGMLEDFKVPLPPLEIQEQIVAELDGYAAIIEGAKKIVENWKPRIDVDPEWPTATIGEQVDIFNGSTPKRSEETYWTNGKVPWFTVADIRDQGREISYTSQFVTEKALAETSIKLLPADTVLLCCTASIGEYAYAKIPLTTNQQFNGLVVKNREILDPKYLYLVVSGFKDVLERMSGKSTFGFVSVGTLKELVFPLPPIEVQRDMIQQYEIEKHQVDSASSLVETYLGVSYKLIQNLWSS